MGEESADVLVIFGITGDLAKVMTFASLYKLERRGLLDCPIVGVAVDHWSVDDLRKHAGEAIEATGVDVDTEVLDRFAARLSYVPGDFTDPDTYRHVAAAVGPSRTPVYYLEIPPFLFGTVVKELHDADLIRDGRVVVEKPLRLDVDNWRWSDVPFFIRTGKRMPQTQTEFRLVFKEPPRIGLELPGDPDPDADELVVRLDPSTGVRMRRCARRGDVDGPEPGADLADHAAAAGQAQPGAAVQAGHVGAGGGRSAHRRRWRLARALDLRQSAPPRQPGRARDEREVRDGGLPGNRGSRSHR